MCAYNYRQYKLCAIKDVDLLEELVVRHCDFTSKDFNYFWKQALESETPTRIKNRLNRKLKPLIRKDVEKKKSTPKNTPVVSYPSEKRLSNNQS